MEETQAPTPTQNSNPNPYPTSATCWSNVVKNQRVPNSQTNPSSNPAVGAFVESCKSSKGIAIAVVDANAIIEGGEKLNHCADKFVTVSEVMDEIRDPVSRHRLAFIPFSVQTMEPSPESLNKVIKFARATGDLQTLSNVDLKLVALTLTLEAQIHGSEHLRDCPPPVHTVNVKRLPEEDLPGWGSNVSNLKEWEALEHQTEDKSNLNSRILPLRDLSLNVASNAGSENQEEGEKESHERRPQSYLPKKKDVKIEGKKMVAEGIDASVGEFDDNADDWMPAVSRSTHRRFLRRKARREYYQALSEKDKDELSENEIAEGKNAEESLSSIPDDTMLEDNLLNGSKEGNGSVKLLYGKEKDEFPEKRGMVEERNSEESLSSVLNERRLEEDSLRQEQEVDEGDIVDTVSEEIDLVLSNAGDDDSSEQSWMLRSLSESSVACITSDFAMQNVILQMGLRLLAPGGMQIRQLHRWILKCHACYTVTAEIGRIFCPKCGNGGTLRKVAVTVGENGIVLAARRPRITLRGTKFSLPLPQGGRDAITKNLILREDQLPKKFLHPKTKKKGNKQDDDLFTSDSVFIHHTDKRAPLQPPVRRALAVFSGRRNPNDNHYSRSVHK